MKLRIKYYYLRIKNKKDKIRYILSVFKKTPTYVLYLLSFISLIFGIYPIYSSIYDDINDNLLITVSMTNFYFNANSSPNNCRNSTNENYYCVYFSSTVSINNLKEHQYYVNHSEFIFSPNVKVESGTDIFIFNRNHIITSGERNNIDLVIYYNKKFNRNISINYNASIKDIKNNREYNCKLNEPFDIEIGRYFPRNPRVLHCVESGNYFFRNFNHFARIFM